MHRASRAVVVVVCLLGGLVATASPALAATISVDAGAVDDTVANGDCGLRDAVIAANTDATFDTCASGSPGLDTISLPSDLSIEVSSGPIDITSDLVIQGLGSVASVIDLAGLNDVAFEIDPAAQATFRQLTIDGNGSTGGLSGGAILSGGDLTVVDSSFVDNSALEGGALSLVGGTATIEDSTFSGNDSGTVGGAIFMSGADLTIRGSEFSANTADPLGGAGGAIFADCSCAGGALIIEDSTFTLNSALDGGALFVFGAGSITGSEFLDNTAEDHGGAIAADDSFLTPLVVENSFLEGNTADFGGAISGLSGLSFAEIWLTDSTVRGNTADVSGGGIWGLESRFEIEGSTISNNTALDEGGGISLKPAFGSFGRLRLTNSTVSGNEATDPFSVGGGIFLDTDTTAEFRHATITDNAAGDIGGGVFSDGPFAASAGGSIIADNVGDDCAFPLDDDATNISTDPFCFPGPTGSILGDPLLGPLANNGGPTETHALLAGSPALNAAEPSPCAALGGVDQRGFPRPSGGGCDLGAYELQVAVPVPDRHTLTVSRTSGGSVTGDGLGIECGTRCSADLDAGKTGTLTAVPDSGETFLGWDGDCVTVDDNECTVEMDGDKNVIASFSGSAGSDPIATGRCKGMDPGSLKVLPDGTLMVAGTVNDDSLNGSGGPDVICGLAGNDTLKGKNQNDVLLGGAGNDKLVGGKGDDRLNGGDGTDSCLGGKGKNKLIACE